MKNRLFFVLGIATLATIASCDKSSEGFVSQGGLLPTNYILVKDSSFSPATLTVVSGSSITFVNSTSAIQTIITDDTTTIRATAIQPNKSYFFKKDTSGIFRYHLVNKPTARGTITITP
ncbi:MAG: hypothetical protein JWQ27_1524 [Ferruginibacter sp.]|nr:hypothetical protein [Ferruginibacter sp.]